MMMIEQDSKTLILNLMEGDCLERMQTIPTGSVDLVLCDMPYGTVRGAKVYDYAGGCKWDVVLPMAEVWKELIRITRLNARIVLFAQEPFTGFLMNSPPASVQYNYKYIWLKEHFANHMSAKKAPVNLFEDVLVFTKHCCPHTYQHNPAAARLATFAQEVGVDALIDLYIATGRFSSHGSARVQMGYQFGTSVTGRFDLLPESRFDFIHKSIPFPFQWAELKRDHDEYMRHRGRIFNLPEGQKTKPNVLQYSRDRTGYHPTQKPVALLKDLIETYSHPGDHVLDFTMGSGSTGVACIETDRGFTGIEKEPPFFGISEQRTARALAIREGGKLINKTLVPTTLF